MFHVNVINKKEALISTNLWLKRAKFTQEVFAISIYYSFKCNFTQNFNWNVK